MLSRKSKDKTIKEGVVGKYVKKETPPEIPSELFLLLLFFSTNFQVSSNHLT